MTDFSAHLSSETCLRAARWNGFALGHFPERTHLSVLLGGLICLLLFILAPQAIAQESPHANFEENSQPTIDTSAKPLPLVVIDPGHGGEKRGTVSDSGIPEKILTLAIAQKLNLILSQMSIRTLLTRTDDSHVGLKDRIQKANDEGAEVFVSIHLNAMPSMRSRRRTRGVETYFLAKIATGEHAENVAAAENIEGGDGNSSQDDLAYILADLAESEAHQDASKLAHTVHGELTTRLPTRNRGVHQAPFMVLKGALMPAILVEVGYLSHPSESKLLIDETYQDKIAQAIAQGITSFLIQKHHLDSRALDGLLAPKSSQKSTTTGAKSKPDSGVSSAPTKASWVKPSNAP